MNSGAPMWHRHVTLAINPAISHERGKQDGIDCSSSVISNISYRDRHFMLNNFLILLSLINEI